MMMWGYGMGWFAWLVMAAWWTLVVVGIVWLVRSLTDQRSADGRTSARRILDERFASGELSTEDYEARRRVLR